MDNIFFIEIFIRVWGCNETYVLFKKPIVSISWMELGIVSDSEVLCVDVRQQVIKRIPSYTRLGAYETIQSITSANITDNSRPPSSYTRLDA